MSSAMMSLFFAENFALCSRQKSGKQCRNRKLGASCALVLPASDWLDCTRNFVLILQPFEHSLAPF